MTTITTKETIMTDITKILLGAGALSAFGASAAPAVSAQEPAALTETLWPGHRHSTGWQPAG